MNKLQQLAELVGISSSYIDKMGNTHYTSDEIRKFFLQAMGYSAAEDKIDEEIAILEREPILPAVISFFEDEKIEFMIKSDGDFSVELCDEEQNVVWKQNVAGYSVVEVTGLHFGYYRIKIKNKKIKQTSLLIYAPKYAYCPNFIKKKEHIYGTAVMLYALRSDNNMGIGDFGDLAEVVKLTAANGGDVVGVSPLGVMSPFMLNEERLKSKEDSILDNLSDVSPYRTLSRAFINYVYVDLRQVAEYADVNVQNFMSLPDIKAEIEALKRSKLVEYARVLSLKLKILALMYDVFIKQASPERKQAFIDFCNIKGEQLESVATFEVLLELTEPDNYWRNWSQNWHDMHSSEVQKIQNQYANRIGFYKYCHWLGDVQLKAVQQLAQSLNMKIGLYGDMPIGAASNGAEVWQNPEAYVLDAGIGAPADLMRPKGQNWGFTPYHPLKLKEQYYRPFIELVHENMQNVGALRIDHAMGLRRLFWGFYTAQNPAVQGAYIYYDIKDLTAILTLESVRAKCLLIGEDLGTVPDGFREYMAEHGLLSYKVLARQKEKDGSFIKPEKYVYMSLAQFSTHDQATACGFWNNTDIEVFKQSNLYVNDSQYYDNIEGRHLDRVNLHKAFDEAGLLNAQDKAELSISELSGMPLPQNIHILSNIYVAKTNSALFLVRVCDIFRQTVLDNAPGTVKEHPNWRFKMSVSIDDMQKTADFAEMMKLVRKNRPQ